MCFILRLVITILHILPPLLTLRGHKIYMFGMPILLIININLICLINAKQPRRELECNSAFPLHDYYSNAFSRHPLFKGSLINNYRRTFHSHHFYILRLSHLYLELEKIKKKINSAFLLYDIWPRPITRTPALGFMKFTILVDLFLVIIIVYALCLIYA